MNNSAIRSEQRLTINREFNSLDQFLEEYVKNISRSGVFIKSKAPLPIGSKVNLKFSILLDDVETIKGEGKVVRIINPGEHRLGEASGMGVVFTKLTSYSEHLLEKLFTVKGI